MKKRLAIVLVPSTLFIFVFVALFVSQFSNKLPSGAKDILDAYVATTPDQTIVTNISHASNRQGLTADMARPLLHAPIEEYRTSPILYDGNVIRAPESRNQFSFPAQELWCVVIVRENETAEYYFLARHDNLYGEIWVLYQSQTGLRGTKETGCNNPLPIG